MNKQLDEVEKVIRKVGLYVGKPLTSKEARRFAEEAISTTKRHEGVRE